MKKLLILSCVLAFCLTLAACHTTDSADSSVPSGIPGSAIANESSAHQTESESSLEESRISQDTTVTSDPTENETTAPAKPADPMSTTEPESEKAPESTTPPQTEPETRPTEPPSESAKAYAGAEDARAVADKSEISGFNHCFYSRRRSWKFIIIIFRRDTHILSAAIKSSKQCRVLR